MTTSPDRFRRLPRYIRDGLVIGAAVGVFGIAFGVFATSNGLSILQACAMSALVFTGASQFAVVSVISTGGTIGAALSTALLLAARNAMYGPVVARWLDGGTGRRLLAAQLVIDESTAVGAAQPDRRSRRGGFYAAGLGVFAFWNLGTLLGGLAGDFIGDPETFGLDAAFPAAFIALMAVHLKERPGQLAALSGGLIALVSIPLAPNGVPILLAALGAIPAAGLDDPPTPTAEAGTGDVMSWAAILGLAAGAYAFKALGLLVLGRRQPTGILVHVITYLPPALLAALVVVQTLAVGDQLVVDERLLGVAAGAIAVWRKAPFVVVLVVAAGVTALARQIG